MKSNSLLKIFASLPIILISLYFIPFLGVCLLLFRCFVYRNEKRIKVPIIIIFIGLIILIPSCLNYVLDVNSIPYLKEIVNSEIYKINFIKYSKLLISIGIIYIFVSAIIKSIIDKISHKLSNGITDYINETEKRNAEIHRQNDMEMKIKQEKAKNTKYVRCPHCGSDNLLSENYGTCKYCRRTIG